MVRLTVSEAGPARGERVPRRPVWLVPATIFVVCWALTTHGKYSVSGDEPHYLMVAQSLWADGDLDLRNNYAAFQSQRFGAGELEPGPHVRETRRGALFPVHDIGVPVLLLPVYVAATAASELTPPSVLLRFRMTQGLFAYSLLSLFIIGLTTAAAAITRSALIAEGAPPGLASGVVLVMWLAPPILSNSFLVFPEPFALLTTAWAVRFAARPRGDAPTVRHTLLFMTALGLLPWIHRKYALYVALLLLAVWWRGRASAARPAPLIRVPALACFVAPQIGLAIWTWYHWGTVGGPLMLDRAPFSAAALPVGALGLLVDRENGLFVWAPIYLLLPATWWMARRRDLVWLLPAAGLFLPSAAHDQWWGGFAPAARFLVPMVPLFALVGVPALKDDLFRRASVALLLPQILIAAYGWQYPRTLWPQGDGQNRVVGAIAPWLGSTAGLLPSLRSPSPDLAQAMLAAAGIVVVNAVVWLAVATPRARRSERRADRNAPRT